MKKEEIEQLEKKVDELNNLVRTLTNKLNRMDLMPDARKHYGIDGKEMYYIGVATGRVYRKPINKEILLAFENIQVLKPEDTRKINKYFMGIE